MDAQGTSLEQVGLTSGFDDSAVEEASAEFLGRWNRLVSTTNWEKGRIICQWRKRLLAAGAPPAVYSDEAWSRRVGNVSPQHVGRLRRTFERFGDVYPQYPGLYWSHFLAALDWDDAEMWLEGAIQNDWSVAEMRRSRWQALGALGQPAPQEDEIVDAEPDEDAPSDEPLVETLQPRSQPVRGVETPPGAEHEEPVASGRADPQNGLAEEEYSAEAAAPAVRPFEEVPPLPDDLQEAFEAVKLAILRHKLGGWRQVRPESVLAALDGLKALLTAPTQ